EGGRVFAGEEVVKLPYKFKNVIKIKEDNYVTSITAKELSELYNSSILQYNYNTQREGKYIKGSLIPVPKTNPKSVDEIKELFIKGDLIVSMLTFNARLGTSDGDEEVEYDPSDQTLTVTRGTLLDALDGYHRISGIVKAIAEVPELDQPFILNVLNYDEEKAKVHFAQMNTINPVEKSRIEELGQKRYSSTVVEQLKFKSELKNKISPQSEIGIDSNFLVTYYTLSEAIDDAFELKSRKDALKIAKYLVDFFDNLFYAFPDEFLEDDLSSIRKQSYINHNVMFYGYVYLAKKMKENNVELNKLENILNTIDFSKSGRVFEELGRQNNENQLKNIMKKKLKRMFYDEIAVV
ncbi:DNA sulfur modification protein DndB, partial [Bacillus velezensis]